MKIEFFFFTFVVYFYFCTSMFFCYFGYFGQLFRRGAIADMVEGFGCMGKFDAFDGVYQRYSSVGVSI